MRSAKPRPYDIVLLGATGFTGRLVAVHLANQGPVGLRWAIAGRDRSRLERLAGELAGVGSPGTRVETLGADVTDVSSIRNLAEQAAVVATTVGPYVEFGEVVVAACAAAGTDYVDLTGEAAFVDQMWLRYHEQAVRSGARIVHACGFDSIPHDLGVWFTLKHLPDGVPVSIAGYVRASGAISGGTYQSAVRAFSQVRVSKALAQQRRKAEQRPEGRRIRALPLKPRRAPDGRGWALPLPTIDPVIVRRSARALDRYGPDFSYGHYAVVRTLPMAIGSPLVLGGVLAVAQVPWGRDLLLRRRSGGDGPPPDVRARSWFRVRFDAEADDVRIVTEVSGGDPGYDETATMLAQSALCLAFDDVPEIAGQVTTAQAMGDALLARLGAHGISFRVIDNERVSRSRRRDVG